MSSLPSLLVSNGYAQNAAQAVAASPLSESPAIARERVTAIAHNYYMQYLALQLSRFSFDLNKPHLKREHMLQAEALITGRMGNDPLDNPRLADLLSSLIDDVMARHHLNKMTWADFYQYEFNAGEGIIIRGEEMLKALLKSNALHYGSRADIYHHTYGDTEYKTLSMHHLIARVLSSRTIPVPGVNAYGMAVRQGDLARIRKIVGHISSMRDPKLLGFFQQNAHHNIKQKLAAVFKELLSESTDLYNVHELHIQLVRSNFNPSMYNPEWRALLFAMQEGLQIIATPYAKVSQREHVAAH